MVNSRLSCAVGSLPSGEKAMAEQERKRLTSQVRAAG